MSEINFDKVLTAIGEKGKYQTVMFILLCIPATLPTAFLAFSNVFTNASPDHWCKPLERYGFLNLSADDLKLLTIPFQTPENKVFSQCSMYEQDLVMKWVDNFDHELYLNFSHNLNLLNRTDSVLKSVLSNVNWSVIVDKLIGGNISLKTTECKHGYEYDRTHYEETLTMQYDLVCDKNWWPSLNTAVFYFGSIFGNIIFGWFADTRGRRPAILVMIFFEVILSIAICFSKDYITYIVMRGFGGLFFPSLYQISFVLGIEMMGPNHRTIAGILISMCFAASMSTLALLAYLLRDWFTLSLATSVPFVLLFGYYWIIPESPRWLMSQGRLVEAKRILQRMADYNGTKIPEAFLKLLKDAGIETTMEKTIEKEICLESNENKNKNASQNLSLTENINMDDENSIKVLNQRATIPGNDELRPDNEKNGKKPYTFPLVNVLKHKNDKIKDVNLNETKTNTIDRNNKDVLDSDKSKLIKNINSLKPDIVNSSQRIADRRDSDDISKFSGVDSSLMKSICLQTDPIIKLTEPEATVFDIFKYPNIRKKFLLLTFDWIVNAVVYSGLSYNVTNLGVNDFLAFFISAIVEVPSYLLAWITMEKWGRKWTLCITLGIGGIACLCCVFVPEELVWVTVSFAMIGKFGVAASFSVFYVFVGESFPTVIRSQAMGLASLVVSFGLLSFPYIIQLGNSSRILPFAILGTLSMCGSLATIFLPETLYEPMPQTLAEGEAFGKDFKIFILPRTLKMKPDLKSHAVG